MTSILDNYTGCAAYCTGNDTDFVIVSKEGTRFPTCRRYLERSEVFDGMLSCCDMSADQTPFLELYETDQDIKLLLSLLSTPPQQPIPFPSGEEKTNDHVSTGEYFSHTLIPAPLIPKLMTLVDKYGLDSVYPTLRTHLVAHVQTMPLYVYGYASSHNMPEVAITASQYLLHPPLSTYKIGDIEGIPINAYQKLVTLHDLRIKLLRELVAKEQIFPFDYGACPQRGHVKQLRSNWTQLQDKLIGRLEAGTDVAGEMEGIYESSQSCPTCHKASIAAVEMLRYKSRRLPKRINQLPQDSSQ